MKKKLLSLIFAICAILPCGILLTACGGCAHTHSFEIKYDDSYHWQECACGYKESETPHDYKDQYDGNNHWLGCACGYKEGDEASHIYDNDCDTTCSACDYERTITHTYSENWTVKDGVHYHICTKCGAIDETSRSVHAYKDGICSICNNIQNAVYSYNANEQTYSLDDCQKATATSITIPAVYDDGIHGSHPVTSIGDRAFYYCSRLTSITIPNSVTSIGDDAFHGCTALTSITIPNSVTSIGDDAFHGCTALTSITIPNSVTSIGNYAFYNCSALTSITIPNSVTSIGSWAFHYCRALTSVYYIGTEDDWVKITIGDYNSKLIATTKYYYIENEGNLPTDGGNYWHYDKNGNPVVWEVTTTEE